MHINPPAPILVLSSSLMAAFSYHHRPFLPQCYSSLPVNDNAFITSNPNDNTVGNGKNASEQAEAIKSLDCSSSSTSSSSLFGSPQPQILANPSSNSSSLLLMESRQKRKTPNGSFEPAPLTPQDAKSRKRKQAKKQAADQEGRGGGGEEEEEEEEARPTEEAPTGYIHVRARRGQATDSHSLAERVRREKIRERMNLLQGLVPGCDKITGKALMLDEIINYVQSLQNQVAFLSMKLASATLLCDFGPDLIDSQMAQPHQQQESSLSMGNCGQGVQQRIASVEEAMMRSYPIMESNPSPPLLMHDGRDPSKNLRPLLYRCHQDDDALQMAAAAGNKRQGLLNQFALGSMSPFQ